MYFPEQRTEKKLHIENKGKLMEHKDDIRILEEFNRMKTKCDLGDLAWLLVPDGLICAIQKLLISWVSLESHRTVREKTKQKTPTLNERQFCWWKHFVDKRY